MPGPYPAAPGTKLRGTGPDPRLSGYRASIAASLLDANGRDVVLIDDNPDNLPAGTLTGPSS